MLRVPRPEPLRNQEVEASAEDFVRLVAEDAPGAAVPREDDALGVEQQDGLVHLLDHRRGEARPVLEGRGGHSGLGGRFHGGTSGQLEYP